jgi:hypothetical protein
MTKNELNKKEFLKEKSLLIKKNNKIAVTLFLVVQILIHGNHQTLLRRIIMSLKDYIRENIVHNELNKIARQVKGNILSYNNVTNRATVAFSYGTDKNYITMDNAEVRLTDGIIGSGPFYGDEAIIDFIEGDIKRPMVIAIVDSAHKYKTRMERQKHVRKGSLVPDEVCGRDGF